MKTDDLRQREEFRCELYRFLSKCYYSPDDSFPESFKRLEELAGWPRQAGAGDNIEALKIDHARLFVGPYRLLASPYGSNYLENSKTLMGDSTMDVKNSFTKAGLDLVLKEAPDHVAIELEFMYFLVFKEIAALADHDATNALFYRNEQLEFLKKHVGKWVAEFTDKIKAGAQTAFFRLLAVVTKDFITEDLKYLLDTKDEPLPEDLSVSNQVSTIPGSI